MKQILSVLLIAVSFLAGCDEDDDPKVTTVVPTTPVDSTLSQYFPGAINSGWETMNIDKVGWNNTYLQQAVDYAGEKNSYSLLILHKGRIVAEHYWQNSNADTRHHIESVSKSMVAVVIGILQDQNHLDISKPVSQYLGDHWSEAPLAKEKVITVRDLLSMTSGLDDDLRYNAPAGNRWYYNHNAFNKLFDVIGAASGRNVGEVFDELLFAPASINDYTWEGTALAMTARDMARFGLMILNRGEWPSNSLVGSDGYFDDMLRSSQPMQKAYGYLWWLNGQSDYIDQKIDSEDTVVGPIYPAMPPGAWLARGHFDQRIEVIPELDLIIIRQGGDTGLPELGPDAFDNQFWTLLKRAIQNPDVG